MRKRYLLLPVIIILLLGLYSFAIEPNNITTTSLSVKDNLISSSLDGYRIVLVSDPHIHELGLRENWAINMIKKADPDLIIIPGDIIVSENGVMPATEFIHKLADITETIVVWGNWDHWSGVDLQYFKSLLEGHSNVKILVNDALRIREGLVIVGIDDPYTSYDNLDLALKSVVEEPVFTVLAAHSPEIIDSAKGKINLILAGHTHGGQVVIPFIGPIFVPLSEQYKKYTYGLFETGGTRMFVTRGLGTSVFPVRFMCPPEIVVITFVSG